MKKQYPKTIVIRKKLILIASIGLIAIISLIIFNLWYGDNQLPAVSNYSAPVKDLANDTDIAWFNHAKISNSPPALPIPLLKAMPIAESDIKAMQAPIASNQIIMDVSHKNMTISAEIKPKNPHQENSQHNNIADKDDNGQNEKKSFFTHINEFNESMPTKIQNPQSLFEIKTGTIIPAILISGINSDLPGSIIAQVRENIFDSISGRYILIPQGAKLFGIYDSSIAYGQHRVLIAWQKIIFPNGASLNLLSMPGADLEGNAGFKDQINNHYGRLLGSTIMLSLMSAGVQLSQPQVQSDNNQPGINQILAQNLGISLSQTADLLLRKNLNIQPTLEIRPGYLFNIIITQDLNFSKEYVSS